MSRLVFLFALLSALLTGCAREALDAAPEPPPASPTATPAPTPVLDAPGGPPACDDGNPCTKDKQVGKTCTHEPLVGTRCDDGNACTASDACVAAHGGAVCAGTPRPAGTSCDPDADACTGTATCDAAAQCIAQPPPQIDDDNPCTKDHCNKKTGVVTHTLLDPGTRCSDGNACTTGDSCQAIPVGPFQLFLCVGEPVATDDHDSCTTDACDPATGAVSHTLLPAGTACSDGDGCTTGDVCKVDRTGASLGCLGAPKLVADDDPCTADTCDPATGVVDHAPTPGAACDDRTACTTGDLCVQTDLGLVCVGTPLPLDDDNDCTADSCDPVVGPVHEPLPAGAACGDTNPCNGTDTCDGEGQCHATEPLPPGALCEPGDVCGGRCDEGRQCVPTPAGTSCSDGDPCNGYEVCGDDHVCAADQPAPDGAPCGSPYGCTGLCFAGACSVAPQACDDGNPCTKDDTCDASGACVGATLGDGASCDDGDACNGLDACLAGACQHLPPSLDDADLGTLDACFPTLGPKHADCDPSHIDPVLVTPLAVQVACLYVDPDLESAEADPIQRDVDCLPATPALDPCQPGFDPLAPGGPFHPARVGLVRGRVLDEGGAPLPGVTVRIHDHPENGWTVTRADGWYDLAVTGGGSLTVDLSRSGYAPAQRTRPVAWQEAAVYPDVALAERSPASLVALPEPGQPAAALAGPATDDDRGFRQALLVFPPALTGTAVLEGGATQPLPSPFHLRVTELTVGELGPARMPGELPAASAYTYALDLAVDEAEALGAVRVDWSAPVALVVEDFLGFGPGHAVPLGVYERAQAAWKGLPNGRTLAIVDLGNGPTLDTVGDGSLPPLDLDPEVADRILERWPVGQSLWYAELPHFSAPDLNYPYGPPPGACAPKQCGGDASATGPLDQNACTSGSLIACESQTLGESLGIPGTPLSLHYASDRVVGRSDLRRIDVKLPACSGPEHARVLATVDVAGRHYEHGRTCPGSCDLSPDDPGCGASTWQVDWDGLDAWGQPVRGDRDAKVAIGNQYRLIQYKNPKDNLVAWGAAAGQSDLLGGVNANGNATPSQLVLWSTYTVRVGVRDARGAGLGGWTLGPVHTYDPVTRTLLEGTGQRRRVRSLPQAFQPVAESMPFTSGDPYQPFVIGADGELYLAGPGQVHRVAQGDLDADGVPDQAVPVAGNGPFCAGAADGEQALDACLKYVTGLAACPDGSLVLADWEQGSPQTVRLRVLRDGAVETLHTFTSQDAYPPQDGPYHLACGAGGEVFATTHGGGVVRIDPSGAVAPVAAPPGGAVQITAAPLEGQSDVHALDLAPLAAQQAGAWVAVDSLGRVYWAVSGHVLRIDPDGRAYRVVGSTSGVPPEDGVAATGAKLPDVRGLAVGPGDVLFVSAGALGDGLGLTRVWRLETDNTLTAVAGKKDGCPSNPNTTEGAGGPATEACIAAPHSLAVSPDATLYVHGHPNRIFAVPPAMPGLAFGETAIPDDSGDLRYVFDAAGRHLRTDDAYLGVTLLSFDYDAQGRVTSVTDLDGLHTTLTYGADLVTITGPYGQGAALALNADGYLASVTVKESDVVSHTATFTYDPPASGLLATYTTPLGLAHTYQYDLDGRLEKDTNPAGGSKTLDVTKTPAGRVVNVTTAENHKTVYVVEREGRPTETRTITEPDGTQTVVQGFLGGRSKATGPDGTIVEVFPKADGLFGFGRPLGTSRMTLPDNAWVFETTLDRQVTRQGGVVTGFTLTSTEQGTANSVTLTSTSTRVFDVLTRTWTSTSAEGHVATTVVDDHGRPLVSAVACPVGYEDPLAGKRCPLPVSTQYDAEGRLALVVQGDRQTTYTYDADGLTKGMLRTVERSSVAQPSLTRAVTTDRDGLGRVRTLHLPPLAGEARDVAYGFDADGRMTGVTPPGRPKHLLGYDGADRMTSYVPPPVAPDDAAGDPAINATVQWTYDKDDTQVDVVLPSGDLIHSTQDASGRIVRIEHDGEARCLGFDAVGRLGSVHLVDATEACACSGVCGDGPVAGTNGVANLDYQSGVLTKLRLREIPDYPPALAVSYARDARLRITAEALEVLGGNCSASFTYDLDGALDTLTGGGKTVTYQHDGPGGRLEGWTIGAGHGGSIRYSEYGELAGWAVTHGAPVYDVDLERDWLGRIEHRAEALAGADLDCTYAYDDASRLASADCGAGVVSYTYDLNGNRLTRTGPEGTETAVYDDQDRLLFVTKPDGGSVDYDYDLDGWVSARERVAPAGGVTQSDTFSYDSEGRLLSATIGGTTVTYGYDPLGHRVVRKVGGETRRWLYGPSSLHPLAEVDGAGNVLTHFVYAPGGRSPALVRHGGATYEVLTDHLGSYRGLVDVATGVVSGVVAYDEFGRITAGEIPAWIPFGWAGGLWDPLTGLVRLGARDYDPETGRWFAKDPVGLAGGVNVYEYAGGDPVNLVDPTGNSAWDAAVNKLLEWDDAGYLQAAGDLFAGVSSGLTFGLSDRLIRATGLAQFGSTCSAAYRAGEIAALALNAAGLVEGLAAAGVMVGKKLASRAAARQVASVGGKTGCFAAGTPIHTEGGLEAIEDVLPGELVWSLDDETGEPRLAEVVRTFVRPAVPVLEVELADGDAVEVLTVTEEHPLWTRKGWKAAGELGPGDEVAERDGSWARVERIGWTGRAVPVYNFEVHGTHSYAVGEAGVWAHNVCGAAQLAANRAAGKAAENQMASLWNSWGYHVEQQQFSRTLFGRRFHDLTVWESTDAFLRGTRPIAHLEVKVGSSQYSLYQRVQDAYIEWLSKVPTYVLRVPG